MSKYTCDHCKDTGRVIVKKVTLRCHHCYQDRYFTRDKDNNLIMVKRDA